MEGGDKDADAGYGGGGRGEEGGEGARAGRGGEGLEEEDGESVIFDGDVCYVDRVFTFLDFVV